MSSIKIAVTAQHIKTGRPGEHCFCPIALACKEAGLKHPYVNGRSIRYIDLGGQDQLAFLPISAKMFVEYYDCLDFNVATPFSFELTPIE